MTTRILHSVSSTYSDSGFEAGARGASVYPIAQFVAELRAIPEAAFSDIERILEFLTEHPIDPTTLEPYLVWDRQHHTRNLIDRTSLYELIAICWDVGQTSSIHNHHDQHCWMAVPIGRLMVQGYNVTFQDLAKGKCRIEKADALEVNSQKPQAVTPEAPVHRVFNPRAFNQRGVSIHVYSRPIDNCIVYSEENQTCGLIELSYTSASPSRQSEPA